MAYKKNKNRSYHSPKSKVSEINNEKQNKDFEFNSYQNSVIYSENYFAGLNIFYYYTPQQLEDLVRKPMQNHETLRELSLILYGTNGSFTNSVDYMQAMPTLDKVVVGYSRKDTAKSRKKIAEKKQLAEDVLKKIKHKEFVRDALFKGMIEGIAFYYFETTKRPKFQKNFLTDYEVDSISEINELGVNADIISLPTNYTKIIGRKNNVYVIAFNLEYFDIGDNEKTESKLRKYPKEIRDGYYKWKKKNVNNGNWLILDSNKTIVHKIRSKQEERYGRPLVLAAISDILYGDYFTQTKRNVLDEINNRIIYQTFPEGKDKGTSALNKTQQQKQHDLVKNAILNKNNRGGTSVFSVAAGTKINSIDASNTDIFDEKYEANLGDKIALDIGFAAALLNGVGSGSYAAQEQNLELITAQLFQWLEPIENELNKCITNNIIKDRDITIEVKYLNTTFVNRDKMVNYAKDLYLQGRGSLFLWASACGISPDTFKALLDYELELDIENKYPVHQTSYTISKNDKQAGRPKTDNPSENTIKSRANNGNSMPSPSDE